MVSIVRRLTDDRPVSRLSSPPPLKWKWRGRKKLAAAMCMIKNLYSQNWRPHVDVEKNERLFTLQKEHRRKDKVEWPTVPNFSLLCLLLLPLPLCLCLLSLSLSLCPFCLCSFISPVHYFGCEHYGISCLYMAPHYNLRAHYMWPICFSVLSLCPPNTLSACAAVSLDQKK